MGISWLAIGEGMGILGDPGGPKDSAANRPTAALSAHQSPRPSLCR